jgi:hypothetical protein
MVWYDMIWYDMIWYDKWYYYVYDKGYGMILYLIWYIIWFMIWYDVILFTVTVSYIICDFTNEKDVAR